MASQITEKEQKKRHLLIEKAQVVRTEFKKQTTTALIAAFGLVIALSWQTLIKSVIENLPKKGIFLYHPYLTDLYIAVIVTLIGVVAILIITAWVNRPNIPQPK